MHKAPLMPSDRTKTFALVAAATILVSAFLLFQVQPIISKMILPWFGGSPAVWSTCMLFFQLVLLAGYGYAHLLTRLFPPRRQIWIHLALLAMALLTLPITPGDALRPVDGTHPSLRILTVLALSVGLPYFLLSSTGPLVQSWFGSVYPGKSPYRLYALSNIGSLAALLSYPFVFEPRWNLGEQDRFWSIGFGLFAIFEIGLVWFLWRLTDTASLPTEQALDETPEPEPKPIQKLAWILLPALASIALLAVTNHLSQDVAAVPFLWVLPLSLYLLTFILCFDSDIWYQRRFFAPAAMASILWIAFLAALPKLDTYFENLGWEQTPSKTLDDAMKAIIEGGNKRIPGFKSLNLDFEADSIDYNPMFQGLFYLSCLFLGCMVCHGELAKLKPGKKHLTNYFLLVSTGGALGGAFVALVCPAVFNWYAELPLVEAGIFLVAACALAMQTSSKLDVSPARRFLLCAIALGLVGAMSGWEAVKNSQVLWWQITLVASLTMVGIAIAAGIVYTSKKELQIFCSSVAGLIMLAALFGVVLGGVMKKPDQFIVAADRSFYGALQVKLDGEEPRGKWLTHGRIQHGYQHLEEPLRHEPTTYYAKGSGVGLAIERHPNAGKLKVGVVGLGTGTIAAYGKQGEHYKFYEIDEVVVKLSDAHFSYRADSLAKTEVVLGDARLMMEREQPQEFDVLAIDAFSGDAIPVHLITRECMNLYLKHLKPDGILAIHISNRYLDLLPVVQGLADYGHMQLANFHYTEVKDGWDSLRDSSSEWTLVTKNEAFMNDLEVREAMDKPDGTAPRSILWTDQYSNLFEILQ